MGNDEINEEKSHKSTKLDEIGYWSEIKHDIIKRYATEYSKIMVNQTVIKEHVYIDAFSGAGEYISRTTRKLVAGSPLHALHIEPPFKHYYFIDLDEKKTSHLHDLIGKRQDVTIYLGDCNVVLLDKVFPRVRYENYRRALCLLDPYGLHLDWRVLEKAGRSVEVFLNFPIYDINLNVVRDNPDKLKRSHMERMDRFWGDRTWFALLYSHDRDLFGKTHEHRIARVDPVLVDAFRKRLMEVAGFRFVPEPMPMRNSQGAVVYYLFFASWKATADKIVSYIFDRYRHRGRF